MGSSKNILEPRCRSTGSTQATENETALRDVGSEADRRLGPGSVVKIFT